jgi:tetratricopeptide (TPR) repeat protein
MLMAGSLAAVEEASAVMLASSAAPGDSTLILVARIQRADYEGDRAALQRLYEELAPFPAPPKIASRVRYWRGFALWRRVLNGFNEKWDAEEMKHDLTLAVDEFERALALDPCFADAKVAAAGCLGNLIYLYQQDSTTVQDSTLVKELISRSVKFMKEARAEEPANPRMHWLRGGFEWYVGSQRGGGEEVALATYEKGLELARREKDPPSDSLDPSWGEPELLMSLAWSSLNRKPPNVEAAEQYAQQALALVPYWHYLRDILIPQIQSAKTTD